MLHRLTNINKELLIATCKECGENTPIHLLKARGYYGCTPARRAWARNRVYKPKTKSSYNHEKARDYQLKRKFGINTDEYDALLQLQNGVCAICFRICATNRSLAVDHHHATGEIRGLLCGRCNRGLGFFNDNTTHLQSAIDYLNRFNSRELVA